MTKRITVGDQTYMFQIWDTAGQEKVRLYNNPIALRKANIGLSECNRDNNKPKPALMIFQAFTF